MTRWTLALALLAAGFWPTAAPAQSQFRPNNNVNVITSRGGFNTNNGVAGAYGPYALRPDRGYYASGTTLPYAYRYYQPSGPGLNAIIGDPLIAPVYPLVRPNPYTGLNYYQPSALPYQLPAKPLAQPNDAPVVAPPAPVAVQVRLPANNAEVWFSGSKTTQTGLVREFVSPALAPGGPYAYTIRARWQGANGPVDLTRTVSVQPGQRVTIDFNAPE